MRRRVEIVLPIYRACWASLLSPANYFSFIADARTFERTPLKRWAYSFDKQQGLTWMNKNEEYGSWWSCSFNGSEQRPCSVTTVYAIDRQKSYAAHHLLGLDWTGLDWTGLDWTGLDWIDEESACRRGHYFSSLESLLTLFLSCRASQTFQNTTMTKAMIIKLATISCRGIAGGSKSVRVPMSTTNGIPTIKK